MKIKLGATLEEDKVTYPKISIQEFIKGHNEKWSARCQIVKHKVTPNCDSVTFTWRNGHNVTHTLYI